MGGARVRVRMVHPLRGHPLPPTFDLPLLEHLVRVRLRLRLRLRLRIRLRLELRLRLRLRLS